jgi:hypothetical protein
LSLISDERIQQVLALMGQPPDARLTPQLAREICERTASAAVLEGSLAAVGSQFVLGLREELQERGHPGRGTSTGGEQRRGPEFANADRQ